MAKKYPVGSKWRFVAGDPDLRGLVGTIECDPEDSTVGSSFVLRGEDADKAAKAGYFRFADGGVGFLPGSPEIEPVEDDNG